MKFPPSEFWSYSSDVYQHPEIEKVCLNMQNQYQADVNILLYCCWTGGKQIQLSENDIEILIKTSQPWQENILKHLRAARSTLKTSSIAIPNEQRKKTCDNICEMELNAEHMNQLALEKAINLNKRSKQKTLESQHCATNNLTLYCQQLSALPSIEQITTDLEQMISTLFMNDDSSQRATINSPASS